MTTAAVGTMPGFFSMTLAERDPEVFKAISDELHRQKDQIELIGIQSRVFDDLAELETERQGRMVRTIDDPLRTEGANDISSDIRITVGSCVDI